MEILILSIILSLKLSFFMSFPPFIYQVCCLLPMLCFLYMFYVLFLSSFSFAAVVISWVFHLYYYTLICMSYQFWINEKTYKICSDLCAKKGYNSAVLIRNFMAEFIEYYKDEEN